ncbi:MAG: hypothetical protein ACKOC0_14435 [Cytophagales bacterium]
MTNKALLFLIFIFYNCSTSEQRTLQQDIKLLSKPPESFTFKSNDVHVLVTSRGTKLIIQPKTLVFEYDGGVPTDSIRVQITEVFSKSEMILNNVTTASQGKPIESFVMINIIASTGNRNLELANNNQIKVVLPRNKSPFVDEGGLFYGSVENDAIEWNFSPLINIRETIKQFGNGQEEVLIEYFRISATGHQAEIADSTNLVVRNGPVSHEIAIS